MNAMDKTTKRSLRLHLLAGLSAVALIGGAIAAWATTTELAGAVVASGLLVVDSNVKKVQHPTGGVVGELRVADGDPVEAGDVVLRLDDTQTRAGVEILVKSLDELAARRGRLEAEQDDREQIAWPAELLARMDDQRISRLIAGEQRLFELRRQARAGQKAQLRERMNQLRLEIQGLLEQTEAKRREIGLVGTELAAMRELWQKNLVQIGRVTALERDAARIEGERGQLVAATAQARGKISEVELQIIQIDQDLRSEVGRELADIRAKAAELGERRIAAEDQLNRVEIRAPRGGRVHQLAVHTVGGVVSPGEPIMLIVPNSEELMVEARVAPQDIDQIRLGQVAVLRFSAFNQRVTPEIRGVVSRIAPDLTQDQRTGFGYYTVRISLDRAEIALLGEVRLVPGMPVEAFVQTGQRTAISYLMKPLSDQASRAFRER